MSIIEIATTFQQMRRFKNVESNLEIYLDSNQLINWEEEWIYNFVKQVLEKQISG